MTSTRHSAATRTGISSVMTSAEGNLLTAPALLCFIVEERYENDVMPGAVVDVLRSAAPSRSDSITFAPDLEAAA